MTSPLRPNESAALAQTMALGLPRPAHWPLDTHLLLALLAAVPVWLALGLWVGPWMQVPAGLWAWCSLVLVQPALEELVFRGLLQGQLLERTTRRLGPVTLANILTSITFVALHLQAQSLLWALAVALPSLVLGHLRERLHSVWPAIGVHAVYNAGFGLTAWLAHT